MNIWPECRNLDYRRYINNAVDRILKFSGLHNLDNIEDKKCLEVIHQNMAYDAIKKRFKTNFLQQTHNMYQYAPQMYGYMADRETILFSHFLPGIRYMNLLVISFQSGDIRVSYRDNKDRVKFIRSISSVSPEQLLELGKNVVDRLESSDKNLLFIRITFTRVGTSHANMMVIQNVSPQTSNHLRYYFYDPHGTIPLPVIKVGKTILDAVKIYGERSKVRYTYSDREMKVLAARKKIGLQMYSSKYDIGYCIMFVLVHIAIMYIVMSNHNVMLDQLGECIDSILIGRFTRCQIMLLVSHFSLVLTQEGSREKNLILEERTRQTSLESKRTPQRHFEIDEKVLDSFYKWLEYEMQKKDPDYTRLMNYAQTVLRFNIGDWNTALEVVQERLLDKKKINWI